MMCNQIKELILGHIKNFLVSRPLKIEKVMRACVFYFYFVSFLQGQIEIFETGDNFTFSTYHEKCISIVEADRKIR